MQPWVSLAALAGCSGPRRAGARRSGPRRGTVATAERYGGSESVAQGSDPQAEAPECRLGGSPPNNGARCIDPVTVSGPGHRLKARDAAWYQAGHSEPSTSRPREAALGWEAAPGGGPWIGAGPGSRPLDGSRPREAALGWEPAPGGGP